MILNYELHYMQLIHFHRRLPIWFWNSICILSNPVIISSLLCTLHRYPMQLGRWSPDVYNVYGNWNWCHTERSSIYITTARCGYPNVVVETNYQLLTHWVQYSSYSWQQCQPLSESTERQVQKYFLANSSSKVGITREFYIPAG
jgi:hypothetical protein